MPQSNKMARLAEDMRRELAAVISEMKDPGVQGLLSVMRVELAPDLSTAKVYVSMMDANANDRARKAAAALTRAEGHVRSQIAARMHIRRAPKFTFVADEGSAYAAHINEVLHSLAEKDKQA